MQRGTGSIRVIHRGTRFVSPARSGRTSHPLARGHSRIEPVTPRAARAAAERDPVGSLRRAARSLTTDDELVPATGRTHRPSSIHWSSPRRALSDPRSFRAVLRPR